MTSSIFPTNAKGSRRAFTVVEVLVVVAIIAIMATAAGGMYMGTFKNLQLEKSAKQIYLAAKYARLAAVSKQIEFRMLIDNKKGIVSVIYDQTDTESDEETQVAVSNPYTRPVKLPEGVFVKEVVIVPSENAAADQDTDEDEYRDKMIVFTPYGTADSAVIKISNKRTDYAISVSPATGKVKIVKGDAQITPDVIDLDETESNI